MTIKELYEIFTEKKYLKYENGIYRFIADKTVKDIIFKDIMDDTYLHISLKDLLKNGEAI